MIKNPLLDISPEVWSAISDGKPVVALESTIIAHGMPYPKNVETALMVEQEIRSQGAIPATLAIINGKLKAGLTTGEIEQIGLAGRDLMKVSRRDIPGIISQKGSGATTVASTMIIAEMVGISIFATGGIGGVHRGAELTMDISADLEELSRTNVAVVCAGAKAILDLALTLEYLETKGVPVIGYQTDYFPAFYYRNSGLGLTERLDTAKAVANVMKTKQGLDQRGGIVIANPVPEEYALDKNEIEQIIGLAIKQAEDKGIRGKEVSPFLLARIEELTGGKSLETNIQLVLNNARLASRIALELAK